MKPFYFQKTNVFKKPIILLFFNVIFAQISVAQFGGSISSGSISTSKGSSADSAWDALPIPPNGNLGYGRDSTINLYANIEKFNRAYRQKGLEFWNAYPKDLRKFEWFQLSINRQPNYWLDIGQGARIYNDDLIGSYVPIDMKQLQKWDSIYPLLRNSFLSSSSISDSAKWDFKRNELMFYIEKSKNPATRLNKKIDTDSLLHMFKSCAEEYYSSRRIDSFSNNQPFRTIEFVIIRYSVYGLDHADIQAFFKQLLSSNSIAVRNWAKKKLLIYDLRITPFELVHPTINGDDFDLSNLRGKVVLLDFWNTGCSACIGRMKELKPVYEKYRNQGFEVISISIDPEDRLPQVIKIKEKIGAQWPTMVIGGKNSKEYHNSLGKQIWNRYAFFGVPQLILLKKNGTMAEINGILNNGDIEPLIKRLLSENIN